MLANGKGLMAGAVGAAALLMANPAGADVIAYWNFNANDGDLYSWAADWGSGTLAVDADWSDVSTTGGSDLNALFGDPAGDGLELKGNGNNGRHINFLVTTTGFEDLVLSFDIERNSPGFNGNQIWYSLDNDHYKLVSPFGPPTAYETMTFDLSSIEALNDADEVYLRIRFNGASNNGGRNRLDNVRVEGSLVPEPGTLALLGLAAAFAAPWRRRHAR